MAMKVFVEFYKQRNCLPQGISFENLKNPVYRVYIEDLMRVQLRFKHKFGLTEDGLLAFLVDTVLSMHAKSFILSKTLWYMLYMYIR